MNVRLFLVYVTLFLFEAALITSAQENSTNGDQPTQKAKPYSKFRVPWAGRKAQGRYSFPGVARGAIPASTRVFAPAPGPPGPDGSSAVFSAPFPSGNDTLAENDQEGDLRSQSQNETGFVPLLESLPVVVSDESESSGSDPLAVDVAMQIQSIREIDEADQKIIIEIDLTVHWKDYGYLPQDDSYPAEDMENITTLLKQFEGEPLSLEEFETLWKPDIFIERVVKVTKPGLLSSPITIRAYKKASSIVYTTRASVKVDCNMNFQYYPADTQNCVLDMRSYQSDETIMNLRWNPLPGAYLVDTDTDDNFDLQLSYVAQRRKRVKDINLNDAIFHVLQIKFSMRRRMTYHLLQTYIPSAFLVFITWLSFLIPEELIEGRIGISMTTLLTLTAMFAAVRENTPVVSYVRAIDIWMVYCIFIVFATLLEFAFFVWLRNYKASKREKKLQNMISEVPAPGKRNNGVNFLEPGQTLQELSTKAALAFERTAKTLNQFAFGFFVLNFIIFQLIYWPWLLIASGHNHWEVNSTLNGQDDTNSGFIDEL